MSWLYAGRTDLSEQDGAGHGRGRGLCHPGVHVRGPCRGAIRLGYGEQRQLTQLMDSVVVKRTMLNDPFTEDRLIVC